MHINLTNEGELSFDNVARLLASRSNKDHNLLFVTTYGVAYVEDYFKAKDRNDILFRFDTWASGSVYIGQEAAKDKQWVARVLVALRKHWHHPSTKLIKAY